MPLVKSLTGMLVKRRPWRIPIGFDVDSDLLEIYSGADLYMTLQEIEAISPYVIGKLYENLFGVS